ncbi:MAG: ABC transporter ATP-binding protein [Bdellovibrionales bacterium]|nr:ABC transporter ATP-binding protein [Bdellovibrionales bacterium]
MIEVQNLTKHYGNITAIDQLSFSIKPGQLVGFLGANGAGKTTTLNTMAGVLLPSSGDVLVEGKSIFNNLAARKHIGYLPDQPPLIDSLTVREYLNFVAQLKEIPPREVLKEIGRVIELCQLHEVESRVCAVLSKGYRQRVGLAQALIGKPRCLILDEPTVGLDPVQIFEFRRLLRSFKDELSIFMSTHILSDVEAVCNDVIVIDRGKAIIQSSIHDLLSQHQEHQKIWIQSSDIEKMTAYIKGQSQVKFLEAKPNAVLVELQVNELSSQAFLKQLVENQFAISEYKHEAIHLEDIYLNLR